MSPARRTGEAAARSARGRARIPSVGIVGPGRAGIGIALALRRAGVKVLGLHGRRRKRLPHGLVMSVGGAPSWLEDAGVVLLAVRDDALASVVAALGEAPPPRKGAVALHLSGALTAAALEPLRLRGMAVGSMHPLMTVSADPQRAAAHFRGATFTLEGDAAAVRMADALARSLGGLPVRIEASRKVMYHAGAVAASNYVVTLLALAEDLLVRAGFGRRAARRALAPLVAASVENAGALGPLAALSGPVMRGDANTIRAHMAQLTGEESRLYAAVGRAALALAREAGLDAGAARAVEAALERD